MITLSEQEFRVKSDEALDQRAHALLPLADEEGFEVELQDGVLDLVFEEPRETQVRRLAQCAGSADLGLGDGEEL